MRGTSLAGPKFCKRYRPSESHNPWKAWRMSCKIILGIGVFLDNWAFQVGSIRIVGSLWSCHARPSTPTGFDFNIRQPCFLATERHNGFFQLYSHYLFGRRRCDRIQASAQKCTSACGHIPRHSRSNPVYVQYSLSCLPQALV